MIKHSSFYYNTVASLGLVEVFMADMDNPQAAVVVANQGGNNSAANVTLIPDTEEVWNGTHWIQVANELLDFTPLFCPFLALSDRVPESVANVQCLSWTLDPII